MGKYLVFGILVFMMAMASVNSFRIHTIDNVFTPKDQLDYAHYLQFLFGTNPDISSISPKLNQFISQYRPSILNALPKVTIVLSVQPKHQTQISIPQFSLTTKFIQEMKDNIQKASVLNLINNSQEQVRQKLNKLNSEKIKVHHFVGTADEIVKFVQIFEAAKNRNTIRMLEQTNSKTVTQASTDSSYLIKFFFSILFIIVSFGTLISIANMQNSRDTLLYAKFIADVGR